MTENDLFNELTMLVYTNLQLDCPILSGNMSSHIEIEDLQDKYAVISISGPSYDLKKWAKEGVIEYTGEFDYAISVNNVGAFGGRSEKSKHWANRSIANAIKIIGQIYNAEVVIDVEL